MTSGAGLWLAIGLLAIAIVGASMCAVKPNSEMNEIAAIQKDAWRIQQWMQDLNDAKPGHIRMMGNGIWEKKRYIADNDR